ncbi:protein kinase, putative [Bodo saltans]|uniref:Protein kinase, putative n=1 Tax=Bodo saltans TaxID=75058 RepID=A0A0S4KIP1_BODSA|nr:protein kinase, putative [Bodo saltans]|eukprot:CUI15556.1 protein kinase, putative [Bodo saltans]
MDKLRQASQHILISQQKDISTALGGLVKAAGDVPHEAWFTDPKAVQILSTVTSTLCGKAMTQACVPQPCSDAISVLMSLTQTIAVASEAHFSDSSSDEQHRTAQLEALLEPFLYHSLHQSLKVLWAYGEDNPTLLTSVEGLMLLTYRSMPYARAAVRHALYESLKSYLASSTAEQHTIVSCVVSILSPIIRGLSSPLASHHVDDMVMYIVPLLSCKKSQTSMSAVEYFASPVTSLLRAYMSKVDVGVVSDIHVRLFRSLLSGFHEGKLYPSLGILISLHRLMEDLDGEAFDVVEDTLLDVCSRAAVSDFPGLATKGLQLFRLESFLALARRQPHRVMSSMANAFHRTNGETHWDVHVRREMLRVWDQLSGWDRVEIPGGEMGGASKSFHDMLIDAWQGDHEAVSEFHRALCAKVATDVAAEEELARQRKERQSYDVTSAAVKTATTHLNLVFGRSLGGGAFGSVHYAKMIERTVSQSLWYELAVKQLSKSTLREQDCEEALKREIAIHLRLSDASRGADGGGIVPLYHTMEDARYYYLLTQYSKYGDLYDAVLSRDGGVMDFLNTTTTSQRSSAAAAAPPIVVVRPMHVTWVRAVLRRVGRAIAFMHRHGIFYGDVKPENVLLVPDASMNGGVGAALLDFGAAMEFSEVTTATEFSGTLDYCSPEILKVLVEGNANATLNPEACDAWSYGCIIVQLLTGEVPFPGSHSVEHLALRIGATMSPEDVCFPVEVPRAVRALLSRDPAQRPSIGSVLEDPWFADVDESKVTPPAKVVAGAAFTSRNSGRRESMMWKRVAMDEVRSGALNSVCGSGTNLALPEEVDSEVQVTYKPRDCLPSAPATSSRSTVGAAGVSPYLTVMPKPMKR